MDISTLLPLPRNKSRGGLRYHIRPQLGKHNQTGCKENTYMSNGSQFNRSLSIGHIITTIGLVIGGFTFIYDLKNEVQIQQFKLEAVTARLDRVVQRTDDQFGEIMDHLIRLEEKLDTMIIDN